MQRCRGGRSGLRLLLLLLLRRRRLLCSLWRHPFAYFLMNLTKGKGERIEWEKIQGEVAKQILFIESMITNLLLIYHKYRACLLTILLLSTKPISCESNGYSWYHHTTHSPEANREQMNSLKYSLAAPTGEGVCRLKRPLPVIQTLNIDLWPSRLTRRTTFFINQHWYFMTLSLLFHGTLSSVRDARERVKWILWNMSTGSSYLRIFNEFLRRFFRPAIFSSDHLLSLVLVWAK